MTTPESLLETVRSFSYPRLAGGDGERRAADAVRRAMRDAGLDVRRQSFRTARFAVRRLRLIAHGAVAIVLIAGGVLAPTSPAAAAAVGVLTLAYALRASGWRRSYESAYDVGSSVESSNVIGRRAADGEDAPVFAVMAHVDTKSTLFSSLLTGFLVVAVVMIVFVGTAWCALAALGTVDPPRPGVVPWLLAVALLVAALDPFGDRSPGALDNASGLAVLLRCARDLPRDPALDGLDLRFIATGAEELGLAGSLRWIQAEERRLPRERFVLVNVDSVGAGAGLVAADVSGTFPGGRSAAECVRAAARATGRNVGVARFLPGAGVDSQPVSARGFATVTLLGRVFGPAAGRMHTARDVPDRLDEAGLQAAVDVTTALAREVALSVRTGSPDRGSG